jgi:nitroreductase
VSADAPSHDELVRLVAAAATATADHAALRPWRFIELRGSARNGLGDAFVEAVGGAALGPEDAARLAAKPLRASLLLAIVVVHKPSIKVADWEQDAAAAGVAHAVSMLLDDAGWGVMWRTGPQTRTEPVRRFHALADNEHLLGWLYVGGKTESSKPAERVPFDAEALVTELRGSADSVAN